MVLLQFDKFNITYDSFKYYQSCVEYRPKIFNATVTPNFELLA